MYTIKLELNLTKVCKKYPQSDRKAIFQAIKNLEINPKPIGAIKLSGREGYRIRVRDYRIIYHVNDKELLILVVEVDKRADIYKKR